MKSWKRTWHALEQTHIKLDFVPLDGLPKHDIVKNANSVNGVCKLTVP